MLLKVYVFVGSVQIISRLNSQSKFQMFTLFSCRHIGAPKRCTDMAAPYSALANLRKIFRRISEVWKNEKA